MTRALFSIVVLVASCTGTETGNPSLTGQMGFVGRSTNPLVVGLPGSDAPIEITRLELGVASLDLLLDGECGAPVEGEVELTDLGTVDLLRADPEVFEMRVAEDAYCGARLTSRSVVLEGTRADGIPFDWVHSGTLTFDMRAPEGPFLVDADHRRFIESLDVSGAIGDEDLGGAIVGPDGVAHLVAPENGGIGLAINAQIQTSAALHRDHDGDGRLDADDLPILPSH